jgi:sulfur-oxidizing protein SoxY
VATGRRRLLLSLSGLGFPIGASGQTQQPGAPASSTTSTLSSSAHSALQAVIDQFTAGQTVQNGRVKLDVAALAENGNAVPVSIEVDSPMTPQNYVTEILLLAPRNPQVEVGRFFLSPANARALVASRIRLATSQQLHAIAKTSDGQFWQTRAHVVVTLAACIDPDDGT